jgi:hypothetical protein
MAEQLFQGVRTSWKAHGRKGKPRMVVQLNAAVGPDNTFAGELADRQVATMINRS